MHKSGFLSVLLLCSVLSAPGFAAPQVYTPVNSWKTDSENDPQSKAFSHCKIENIYSNNVLLMLAENAGGTQRMILDFPSDKMKADERFDLALQVDKMDVFPVEALAISPRTVAIAVPSALPDQMRKGKHLFLRGANDEMAYDLKGIAGAITALHDCVASAKGGNVQVAETQLTATMAIPAVIPPVKPVPVPVAAKPKAVPTVTHEEAAPVPVEKVVSQPLEKTSVLPTYWQNAFAKTTMAPDVLMPVDLPKPLDYAWKKHGASAGIAENLPGTFEQASMNYLRSMKAACGTSFIAEAAPMQQSADGSRKWQLVETACSSDRKRDTIAALAFVAHGGKNSLVVIEGSADQGAETIRVRNDIVALMQ